MNLFGFLAPRPRPELTTSERIKVYQNLRHVPFRREPGQTPQQMGALLAALEGQAVHHLGQGMFAKPVVLAGPTNEGSAGGNMAWTTGQAVPTTPKL